VNAIPDPFAESRPVPVHVAHGGPHPVRTRGPSGPLRVGCARLVLGLTLLSGACTRGPDFEPPAPPAPEEFRGPMPAGASVANTEWFDLYQDPVLRDLIARGLENNRGVREAMARIEEARSGMTIANADRYPKVTAVGAGLYQQAAGVDTVSALDNLRAVVGASYEVDLWGRVARSNEAALQGVLATEEAFRTVTITLVAEITSAYLVLRDVDARIAVAEQTVAASEASVALMAARAEGGMVPDVDVRRAEINLADSEAVLVALGRARAQTENVLSLLVGELPSTVERGLSLAEQPLPPAVPAGLPSELLQRRPDILGAERALHAQTARIGIAEAARFPALSLTGNAGAKQTTLGDATSGNFFFNLGANLVAPIFNSGALKAAADAERARTVQALNQYEQTVLNAFREVEDALVAVETYRLEQEARTRQLEASRLALSSVQSLYDGGVVSYQEVIDLQRGVFGSELRVSEALQLHHVAIVQLYRALGGGWTPPEGWQSVVSAATEAQP
jgi:multidrug efflux system outer membrane protein